MNNCKSAIFVVLVILAAVPVFCQTMTAHYPDHDLFFNLEAFDSLTFEEEYNPDPHEISLSMNPVGDDAGVAGFRVEFSAIVLDENRNPVKDGTPVLFYNAETSETIGYGETGRGSRSGEEVNGVACIEYNFFSSAMNSELTVASTVERSDGSILSDTSSFRLPLQHNDIEFSVNRQNVHFNSEYEVIEVELLIINGNGNPVNNELVRFISNRGTFYTQNSPNSPSSPEMLTGDTSEYANIEDGSVRRYLIINEDEAFLNPAATNATLLIDAVLPNALNEIYNCSQISINLIR